MRTILLTLALGVLGPLAAEAAAQDIVLGARYKDALHGFSLRPPTDTERRREYSQTRLVSWLKKDAKTGAVAWTFTVYRATEAAEDVDLQQYARRLPDNLPPTHAMKVDKDSVRRTVIAGKGAIQLSGETGGNLRLWEQQTWVLVAPRRFLVFAIRGPRADAKVLAAMAGKILDTLVLSDPEAEKKARVENLDRGKKLLESLDDAAMKAAVREGEQWFLMKFGERHVGWMRQMEGTAKHRGRDGWQVSVWVMLRMPRDNERLMKRVLFTTADRSMERWREQLQVGEGANALSLAEDGLLVKDTVVSNVSQDGQIRTREQKAPTDYYLPRAMAMLLPRLVKLDTPQSWAFAAYSTPDNAFDVRTFSVVGKDRITIGSRRVEAVKATDQPSADAEPATLWLDEKGNLLRMTTGDGLTMEPAGEKAVTALFPKAKRLIDVMKGWAAQP